MRPDVRPDLPGGATEMELIAPVSPGQQLLAELLRSKLVRPRDWQALPEGEARRLRSLTARRELLDALVGQRLLTRYQADRIDSGNGRGLILGNYRVLERLGGGAMGIVFLGEHLRLPRRVAIKVFPNFVDSNPNLLQRFYIEMEAVARLQHPNVVAAFDAGELAGADSGDAVLHYFVMEYCPGRDLERHVQEHGPLGLAEACDVAYQIAGGLDAAHRQQLIHRDVKPANILITEAGQAKLLDFGLARRFHSRLTEPGIMVGTLDYLPPEQAVDAHNVDGRADMFGLGATLFWCLTGRPPFPPRGTLMETLDARLHEPPPSVRDYRPDLPAGFDALLRRMMATRPADRFPDMAAVMKALLPFVGAAPAEAAPEPRPARGAALPRPRAAAHRVLVVDDEPDSRMLCRMLLEGLGLQVGEAENGRLGWEELRRARYDLALLDFDMPEMTGPELLRRLRADPPVPNLKVVMFSGMTTPDEMAQTLTNGADDYLSKPVSPAQLSARVLAALRLKDAQDRSDALARDLLAVNQQLERSLSDSGRELEQIRSGLVLVLAELAAHRQARPGAHLHRLRRYCRALAETAATMPCFAGQIDEPFVRMVETCAPLLDIGELSLPDDVLRKAGKLDPDERLLMQTHTTLAADLIGRAAGRYDAGRAFFQTAIDIARHHHERHDGRGYPDQLAGDAIPLSARIVALGDAYDTYRSHRPYKPALSHGMAVQLIRSSEGQFDPRLVEAFLRCERQFREIFEQFPD